MEAYGYCIDDLKKRKLLKIPDEKKYIEHLKKIADKYPFLAIAGLRILTEIKLKSKTFNDKDTLGVLINKLKTVVPDAQIKTLKDFKEFENSASHGYEISETTAKWALDAIPAFLRSINKEKKHI